MNDVARPELPTDIPGVVARLREITAWSIEQKSPVGYFAGVYREVTERIESEINKGAAPAGAFEDPERMRRFDVVFANRFLTAFDAWRAGDDENLSASWRLAFETAEKERVGVAGGSRFARLPVLVHLLLSVNAHMNLDLGCAATEIAPGASFPALRGDFDEINKVLATLSPHDKLKEESIAPLERFADRWGWLSNTIIDLDIEARRRDSWRFAEKLAPLEGDARRSNINARDEHVQHQGSELLDLVQNRVWSSPKHIFIRPLVLLDAWFTAPTVKVIRTFDD